MAQQASLTNLPLALTNFIGREREMAEVIRLLSTTRVLTLTGAGGSGKTRLALQIATDLLDTPRFPNGVWLAELAALSDPVHIPRQLANIFNVSESPGIPLDDALIDYLRAKQLLLVLDNCEHLVGACAQLVEQLLRTCPRLTVLATSREALAIPGEITFRVPSLALPDSEHLPSPEMLLTFEAIRLFVERAMATKPDFRMTDVNASSIAHICERLDGMPLAIELAATRVKTLSVQQIAGRLDDRFQLLTTGTRTAVSRQQTLVATVEWSYNLLSEDEQRMLRQLSVFVGGWTLEAAETVCAGEGIQASDILDLLTRLVDKSLVMVEEHEGAARYHLLETIRQYARAKLLESAEVEMIYQRQLEWLVQFAREADLKLRGAEMNTWLRRLDAELDNFRTALEWGFEHERSSEGSKLTAALAWYFRLRNHYREAKTWAEKAERLTRAAPADVYADALFALGLALNSLGEFEKAESVLHNALTLYRTLGNQMRVGFIFNMLGVRAHSLGEFEQAEQHWAEALRIRREIGDTWGITQTLQNFGDLAERAGDYPRAKAIYEEGLALSTELGDKLMIARRLNDLGSVAQDEGNLTEADTMIRRAVSALWQMKEMFSLFAALESLAQVMAAQGQPERAIQILSAIESARAETEINLSPVERIDLEKIIRSIRDQMGDASFVRAHGEGRSMTLEQAVDYALAESARLPTAPRAIETAAPQPDLRIVALGATRVWRGDHELTLSDWTYAKARELFFYLLCSPPRAREHIGVDLWLDASPAQLRSNLKVTLYHLRRALGHPNWILFENEQYAFNRSLPYWFDVEAFELNLAEARKFSATAPLHAIELLEQALKLYRGDFLSTWERGEWFLARQAELQRHYIDALILLGELRFAHVQYGLAADAYRQAIAKDNYLEVAHRELMRCLARQGEPGQALRHYKELVKLLRDEMGAPPAPETKALYEKLKRGEAI